MTPPAIGCFTPVVSGKLCGRPRIDRQLLAAKAEELDRTIRELSAMRDGLRHAIACRARHRALGDADALWQFLRVAAAEPCDFLLQALQWINRFTTNWGFAIIVLTILIKVVLYPLQHKSIVSMKRMQRVQPKMEAIKAKYKKARSDPEQRQKMNTEMMKLYQTEGINPMSGCLPILQQLPILRGFYNLLSRAIELRGAPWILWINDLSEKDPTYILPILMTATMFMQTYITPTTADPVQRKIFLAMPLVFGIMFKEFPSGLVLYWLVQNILTIAQQLIMNKWWKDHPGDVAKA